MRFLGAATGNDTGDAAKAVELSRRRGELETALMAAEELWLSLSSEAEKVE